METYTRPQYPEQVSKKRVIQNGDTRDNKNFPTSRGVGYLHRHILPHTDLKSIQWFHIQGQSYHFKALPFGLSTVSIAFTVVAKEVKLLALQKGIRIHQYLDDWYLDDWNTAILVALCQERLVGQHGESELDPKQVFNQFDLKEGNFRPTLEHWQTLKQRYKTLYIVSGLTCPVQQLISLIGLLTATEQQVHLG